MSKILSEILSIEHLLEKIPDVEKRLSHLYAYLQTSEDMLRTFMDEVMAGRPPPPMNTEAEGDMEFGMFLHWLNNPDESFDQAINENQAQVVSLMALRHFTPTSAITVDFFNAFLESPSNVWGYVSADGTLWALEKYAQLDLGWLTSAINYAINKLDEASIYHPYPPATQAYHGNIGNGQDHVSIAIIGDWGTGPYGDKFGGQGPAVAVMNAVGDLNPDYLVHMGDVYYCGTAGNRFPFNEERDYLLAPWSQSMSGPGRNFTLNSNHEMYGAAKGLIEVALTKNTPFSHQNSAPYFALEHNKWVLIGLDSAYFDPSTLYMDGAVGGPEQQAFVDGLELVNGRNKDKKVMIMTHHNPMSFDGQTIVKNNKAQRSLWDNVKALLGKQPDRWYWGHLHLGVAYNENSILGNLGTVCRCIGHSAIPFGNASGMVTNNVDYYAHTPLDAPHSKQVQNGFSVLTIHNDGRISEVFYEVTNDGGYVQKWPVP